MTLPAWGAVPTDTGTRFRIWAPDHDELELLLPDGPRAMEAEGDGWWSLTADAPPGTEYGYRLPDGLEIPDPASRLQAGDVHGRSVVTGRDAYDWQHERPERPWHEAVIYELHLGTFTPEGTYRAAIDKLDHLRDLGVTAIDILPVAQFAGRRGWGYDGVLLYAPHNAYGSPDDLRALVDAAHGRGIMVMLDVVYNHFGPDGNYLPALAPAFFDQEAETPWGSTIDYDRDPVRRFAIENATYWIENFRIDGLRFDAIDHIADDSDPDLLTEMAREIRRVLPGAWLMTEDNRNVTYLHERGEDGTTPLMDGEWNDDWHNAAHVVATDETEGYYAEFADDPTGWLARACATGFAYQGEGGRGVSSGHLPPVAMVNFLQNHDQIGNRAVGERLTKLTPMARLEALQAMLLLSPQIPLLFMGEEWNATEPFLFFADFEGELATAVTEGRRREFSAFVGFTDAVPDPIDPQTFARSRLVWDRLAQGDHQEALARTRELIALRRDRIVPLLDGVGGHAGRHLHAPKHCIATDWHLNGGLLQMRANFAHHPEKLAPVLGETLHLTGPAPGAPNSVLFALAEGGA
ncbi:malto-oligosyltrehalose trehalohydrolase [Jannaschia formosa]|uniref:malto-oligosyltrehalose trehalohydrolase n=1 Tax=Jannaschia formosa TaxID=2259592 RepID=UPI000E1B88FD|nr:malto-oligosyltrehalose trehalohydrolase [Jannaschia formosa]TFL18098.1 malto-oligosyltrehalose trehalohydrolase [Jannaschia formosa]